MDSCQLLLQLLVFFAFSGQSIFEAVFWRWGQLLTRHARHVPAKRSRQFQAPRRVHNM
jgi:hypothetical protein